LVLAGQKLRSADCGWQLFRQRPREMKQFALERFLFAGDVGQRSGSDFRTLDAYQNSCLTVQQRIDNSCAEPRGKNAIECGRPAAALLLNVATKNAQRLTTPAERASAARGILLAMKTQTVSDRPAKLRSSIANEADGQGPIAIKKILAPTDFSPASEKALRYARRFAEELRSEVTLLHILEPVVPLTFEGLTMASPSVETQSSEAEKRLKTLVAFARGRGIAKVKPLFRRGVASHEIVEAAKELDVDLIVMATHGYTGWKHFCIGSTAERVVRAAPCPVLVVREKEHDFL
jgi:universal stress protein A